jgi:asparagine N-glycosylation enzyme membrane subunit Stt3
VSAQEAQSTVAQNQSTTRYWVLLIGLVLMLVNGLHAWRSAFNGDVLTPVGYDAFYHATRIAQARTDGIAALKSDDSLFWPHHYEASWPWGYDYLLAKSQSVVSAIGGERAGQIWLWFVPCLLGCLTVLCLLAILRRLDLKPHQQLCAVAVLALAPLAKFVFSFGMLDHHGAEALLVSVCLLTAIRWMEVPNSSLRAAMAGLALASTSLVHTELFLLGLPLLAGFVWAWWRENSKPTLAEVVSFGVVAVGLSALINLPQSLGAADAFAFGRPSWFQPYMHFCVTAVLAFLSWAKPSMRTVVGLAILSAVVIAPTLLQISNALEFVSGGFIMLAQWEEAHSPLRMWLRNGIGYIAAVFGIPMLLALTIAPLLAVWNPSMRSKHHLLIYGFFLLGLLLTLAQFRFFYYAIVPAAICFGLAMRTIDQEAQKPISLIVLLAVVGYGGWQIWKSDNYLAQSQTYAISADLYPQIAQLCRENPGSMLLNPNFGNYVRYHTSCPVMMANSLVGTQEDQWMRQHLAMMADKSVWPAGRQPRYVLVSYMDERLPVLQDQVDSALFVRLYRGENVEGFVQQLELSKPTVSGKIQTVARVFEVQSPRND